MVGVTALLTVTIVAFGFRPISAGASGSPVTYPPYPLLPAVVEQGGLVVSGLGGQGPGLYAATAAQYAALQDFQAQAIQNTLADHGLPQSDATAVQTWGRSDALAELWLLIAKAIAEPACTTGQTPGDGCRTSDQQNVVVWMEAVDQRDALLAAQDAGLEYVKWAGLSESGWASLIASNPSEGQITSFLCGGSSNCPVTANNYAGQVSSCPNDGTTCVTVNGNHYTEGFCAYTPPAPLQSSYSATNNAVCYGPCPFGTECNPLGPSYDQLVQFGAADVQNQLFDTPAAANLAREVAVGVAGAAGTAAAIVSLSLLGVVTGAVSDAALGPASTALFPFAASLGVTAAGVGALAVIAIAGAILVGYYAVQLFNAAQVPSQIATLIGDASSTASLNGAASNSTEMQGLYSLFIGAALPAPDAGTCNECLNAPAIPAESSTDPEFVLQQNTGTASNPTLGAATDSPTMSWKDSVDSVTNSAYLSGNWFVESTTNASGTSTAQSLRIHYTDWHGNGQTAWLEDWPNVNYKFVIISDQSSSGTAVDPSTCLADKTCAVSSSIDFVGTDGKEYQATVINPAPIVGTPQFSSSTVTEGAPVQLSMVATSPVGSAVSGSFTIQDKPVDPSLSITICENAQLQVIPCSSPTVTVSGNPVTYTFPTSGPFTVNANAVDAAGRVAHATTTVNVADVAPTVSLDATCNSTVFLPCVGTVNRTINPPGSSVSLAGSVLHAGSEDVESVSINWGDGSTPDTLSNSSGCVLDPQYPGCDANISLGPQTSNSGQWTLPFLGQHVYASGTHTVTVKVTDQSGATSSVTLPETVLYPTLTTVTDDTGTSVFGQPVSFTATVTPTGGSLPSSPPTGDVQFLDGGTLIGIAAVSTSGGVTTATVTTSALAVGSGQTITADYVGDAAYWASQSSAILHEVKAQTSLGLTSAPNPSVFGQSVTFTATVSVTSPGTGTPTGTVEFKDGSSAITNCASQPLSTTSGQATCTTAGLSVSTHDVTAIYSGDGNDAPASSSQSITVGADAQSIVLSAAPSAPVAGGVYAVSATSTSGATVALSIAPASSAVCSIASGTVTFNNVGTCTIDASVSGSGNYAGASSSQSIIVGAAPQSIVLSAVPSSPVAGGTYAVSATSTSGATVALSIASASSTVCSIASGTVTFNNIGTCTIDASVPANGNYAQASTSQSITVGAGGSVGGASLALLPNGAGYWVASPDGAVAAYGSALGEGSMAGKPLNKPIVGMASTPDGRGYWLVAADGGVFSFGDAGFYGSTGGMQLNRPIVGMASTPDGRGYWLVAADGGVFSFGDAGFYGSTGSHPSPGGVIGLFSTKAGSGYTLVSGNGTATTF